jgi:hypothetical protein
MDSEKIEDLVISKTNLGTTIRAKSELGNSSHVRQTKYIDDLN